MCFQRCCTCWGSRPTKPAHFIPLFWAFIDMLFLFLPYYQHFSSCYSKIKEDDTQKIIQCYLNMIFKIYLLIFTRRLSSYCAMPFKLQYTAVNLGWDPGIWICNKQPDGSRLSTGHTGVPYNWFLYHLYLTVWNSAGYLVRNELNIVKSNNRQWQCEAFIHLHSYPLFLNECSSYTTHSNRKSKTRVVLDILYAYREHEN
jgi:hypothetical protein